MDASRFAVANSIHANEVWKDVSERAEVVFARRLTRLVLGSLTIEKIESGIKFLENSALPIMVVAVSRRSKISTTLAFVGVFIPRAEYTVAGR